jgi:hypothetical protein
MSQADEDEWAKARQMVRDSPPGTAQVQWPQNEPAEEPPHRRFPTKPLLLLLIVGLVAGGLYFVWAHGVVPRQGSTATADKQAAGSGAAGSVITTVTAPAARQNTALEFKTASIKNGLRAINVRSAASANSALVGKLSEGDRIERIAQTVDWVRIRFQNGTERDEGWVRRDLLEE